MGGGYSNSNLITPPSTCCSPNPARNRVLAAQLRFFGPNPQTTPRLRTHCLTTTVASYVPSHNHPLSCYITTHSKPSPVARCWFFGPKRAPPSRVCERTTPRPLSHCKHHSSTSLSPPPRKLPTTTDIFYGVCNTEPEQLGFRFWPTSPSTCVFERPHKLPPPYSPRFTHPVLHPHHPFIGFYFFGPLGLNLISFSFSRRTYWLNNLVS
jgi:hypothetical protein